MGAWTGHKAKFVRRFANSRELRENAVRGYCEAVRSGSFPDPDLESYTADKTEWARFLNREVGEMQ